ncbi:MAG TPA: rod shape-determining protein MreC [Clostridiales bacterium]|nr:rod shape-determining protein MreC [Clostridiales bacterium]
MKIILQNLKKFIIVLVVLILIITIGITSSMRDEMTGTENFFGTVISYMEKITYNIGQTVSNAFKSVQNITKINEENEMLKENLYKLREENRILKNIVNTSDILEAEYKLRTSLTYDYVIGQVIAKDDSNWFSRFTIDKGSKDGVSKNDIVIQAVDTDEGVVQVGLVGVISEVGHNWAKVTTIIDENCKVSFRNVENNENGIISGNVDGSVTGFFLDNKAEAKVGDELFTSGIGDIYLKDIFIGEISDIVDTTDASSKKIYVDPVIEFTNIYKVFVLKVNR